MKNCQMSFELIILMVSLPCLFDVIETQLSCGAPDILKWFITVIFGYHRYSALSQWDSKPLHWSFLATEMQHKTKT